MGKLKDLQERWYKLAKSKLMFLPVEEEKPINRNRMVYLSVRIDGRTKTKISANIEFDNKQE